MTAPLTGSEFVKVVFTPRWQEAEPEGNSALPGVVPDAAGIVPPVPINATGSPGLRPCRIAERETPILQVEPRIQFHRAEVRARSHDRKGVR